MKRVQVWIEDPFRGVVSKYASHREISMPRAYAELLAKGLLKSEMELEDSEEKIVEDKTDLKRVRI